MSHHGRGRGRYNRPSYNNQNRLSHQNNYSQPAYSTQSGYAASPAKTISGKEPEQYSSESINEKGAIGNRRRIEQSATSQSPVQQHQQQQQPQQQQQQQQQQQHHQQQQQVQIQQQQAQAQQAQVQSQPQVQQQQHQPQQHQPQQQQPPLQSQKPMPVQQQQPTPPIQQPVVEKNVQEQPAFTNTQSIKQDTDNQLNSSTDDLDMDQEGTGEVRKKYKPWMKKGALGIKISRKIKKRRQNARLRNILAPKNAMMVLHELHPELKMTISEQPNAANQMGYTVEIEIDGKIYRGHGMSKICAKQAGSENALKAVLLEKLEQNNVKLSSESVKSENNTWEDVEMPQAEANEQPSIDEGNKDGQDGANKPFAPGRQIQEDDVPWGSLASFALYKLFSEWQSQGFQLPASSGLPAVFQKAGVPLPYPKKLLPEDASKKHPVQLLNQIRPGCQYIESREGMPPNLTFTFSVVVDGQTFTGVGTNKKDAKKECAKHALEAMGVKYD